MRGSTKSNNTFFYVKIKGLKKDEKKPYFEFQQKVGEKYEEVDKQDSLTGCLDGPIKIKHFTFEDRDCVEYKVSITDSSCNETYILSLGNSGISRNILNSILSLEILIEPLNIGLYVTKSKKDGKEYKQVSVRNNLTDQFVPWRFPITELNTMIEPIKDSKGKTIKNDTSKLDEFLESQVVEWNKKFTITEPKKETPTQEKNNKVKEEIADMHEAIEETDIIEPIDDDNLPF